MKRKLIGFLLILASIVLTFVNKPSITGASIGSNFSNSISLIGAVIFIIGLMLTVYTPRKRSYALEALERGGYINDTRELKSIARHDGYTLEEGHKEGTRVLENGRVITVIPNHRKIEGKGTAKGILKALATHQSSFRQRSA